MKKIVTSIMWFAVLAAAFISCQKQEVVVDENNDKVVTELVFTSEKPAFVDETKTEWTGETIQWSAGDYIRVAYTCDGIWQNKDGSATADEEEGSKTAKIYASTELGEATDVAEFYVPNTFTSFPEGEEYVFFGVYPSTAISSTSMESAPSVTVTIPAEQTPLLNSFDSKADLMAAKSTAYSELPQNVSIPLMWSRLVAHGHFTLNGLKVDGQESISTITLTANSDADMVGTHYLYLDTYNVVKPNSNVSPNVLTVNGKNLTIDASGNVTFWTCFLPCTWTSITVQVETDKATYTREIDLTENEKTFVENARNLLKINMNTASRVAKVVEDYSGTYAILAEKSSSYYYLTNVDNGASTKRLNSEEVNSLPEPSVTLDASKVWNVIKNNDGTYYIQSVENNYYLDHTSDNSAVLTENIGDAVALTILKEDEKYSISYKDSNSENRNFVKNNSAPYFAFYTSVQCGNVHLVPVNAAFIPQIIISSDTEQSVAAAGGDVVFNYTLKNLGDLTTVTAIEESEFLDVDVDVEDNTVTVTVSENKTPNERSAQVTLTCGEATPVVLTITQLGASSDVWELVTDAASILVGDEIVIVAEEYEYALSTTQGNNNRGQAEVTKNNNTVSFGNDVQIMTVEAGKVDGTFAFNTGSGYLYAASSSSNYLRTKADLDDNGSWNIEITNGIATIKAQGSNTRNWLRYNSGSSLFSCYASGQKDILIYKKIVSQAQ